MIIAPIKLYQMNLFIKTTRLMNQIQTAGSAQGLKNLKVKHLEVILPCIVEQLNLRVIDVMKSEHQLTAILILRYLEMLEIFPMHLDARPEVLT